MLYYDTVNEVVTNMAKIRKANPNMSFSFPLSTAVMDSLNICPYATDPFPDYNHETQKVVQDVIEIRDGTAYLTWSVVNKTAEEIQAETVNTEMANRAERDGRLILSDITIVRAFEDGTTVSQAYKDYRQALRDLPTHANWPDLEDADWPVEP